MRLGTPGQPVSGLARLKNLLQRIAHASGTTAAVRWTVAPRVWSVVAGPPTLVLIATHLTPDEQGFYYAFSSIVALQVFFDLGLAFVIQQFASHEKAFLEWRPDGTIDGRATEKGRLASLLRTALKWYGIASVLMMISLLTMGSFFFAMRGTTVHRWQQPWIVLALAAGSGLILSPLLAMLEGCGQFVAVARVRTAQAVLATLTGWAVLAAGGRLWAPPAVTAAAVLVGVVGITVLFRRFYIDLLRTMGSNISWREEVWPFQWRIAVSWISGYFMFQLFTPVLFAYHGPAAAGRMGMSSAVVAAMLTVSMSWLTTKVPTFGEQIARRDFAGLDALFFPTMRRSLAVMALGCSAFFGGVLALRALNHPWGRRVIDPLPLSLLLLSAMASLVVTSEAVYLRAHKREPFLAISVLYGVLAAASTLLLGRHHGAAGMMGGFLIVTLAITIGGTCIFIQKRREWHQ